MRTNSPPPLRALQRPEPGLCETGSGVVSSEVPVKSALSLKLARCSKIEFSGG